MMTLQGLCPGRSALSSLPRLPQGSELGLSASRSVGSTLAVGRYVSFPYCWSGVRGWKVPKMKRLVNSGLANSAKAVVCGLERASRLNPCRIETVAELEGVSALCGIRNAALLAAGRRALATRAGRFDSSWGYQSALKRRRPVTQWKSLGLSSQARPLFSEPRLWLSARGGPSQQRCLSTSTTVGEDLELNVEVQVEEDMTVDDALKAILEQLEADARLALDVALQGVEIDDNIESVELSVLLCSDTYIADLNQEWRGVSGPTDVLSFPQDEGPMGRPVMLLGDVVISLDTAVRQAEERSHTLLDELRILLVHGMLHVMGYDHETGEEGAKEMAAEERHILKALQWKGSGLIDSSNDREGDGGDDGSKGGGGEGAVAPPSPGTASGPPSGRMSAGKGAKQEEEAPRRTRQPTFKYLFLDMDGTLLNSQSRILPSTTDALLAAVDRGVQIVIATGKARPAALAALKTVGLAGNDRILSLRSPGVFLQGLQVYGTAGKTVHTEELRSDVCTEAFAYSLVHKTALAGFSGDRIVTLLAHPKLDDLHETFFEPRAEVMPSIETLLTEAPIQKLLFYDTVEGVSAQLRPRWTAALNKRASVTQAVSDMLEILPLGANKGRGVALLLDHLDVPAEQVMAVGDGENDLEMIQMVGLGVAMGNGVPLTRAAADAIVASNDEGGIAEAIERFILL